MNFDFPYIIKPGFVVTYYANKNYRAQIRVIDVEHKDENVIRHGMGILNEYDDDAFDPDQVAYYKINKTHMIIILL